nr:hypothetical protein [Lacticaseibacillus paracasei]
MVKAMPEDIKQEANKVVNVDFTGQEQWRNDLKLDGNGGIRNPLSLKAYMIPDGVHVRLYYFIVVLKQKPRVAFWLFEAVVESGYFICLSKFAQSRLVRETAF